MGYFSRIISRNSLYVVRSSMLILMVLLPITILSMWILSVKIF
jgi:hypothetical protein